MSKQKQTYYVAYCDVENLDEIGLEDVRNARTSLKAAARDVKGYSGIPFYKFTVEVTDCVEITRRGKIVKSDESDA